MSKVSRKSFVCSLLLVLILLAFEATGFRTVLAATPTQTQSTTPNLTNPTRVFFQDQGFFVADQMLKYWRGNGRLDRIGAPAARLAQTVDGQIIQFFDKVAIAIYPELAGTQWEIRPYQIGRVWFDLQPADFRNSGPYAKVSPLANTQSRQYFPETGHVVQQGFLTLFRNTGEVFWWGFPLSEEYPVTLNGKAYRTQLFERGRMLWEQETNKSLVDPTFGKEMAQIMGAPIVQEQNVGPNRAANYNEVIWEHWVDVNLSTFTAKFMEGDVVVRSNLIISGKPGHETPTGTYYIFRRVANERMKGGSIGSEDYYDLDNVLFTQYFTGEGHALHYAWWRSSFGYQASHGCVNMDYDTSLFAWNWMDVGGRVYIHY